MFNNDFMKLFMMILLFQNFFKKQEPSPPSEPPIPIGLPPYRPPIRVGILPQDPIPYGLPVGPQPKPPLVTGLIAPNPPTPLGLPVAPNPPLVNGLIAPIPNGMPPAPTYTGKPTMATGVIALNLPKSTHEPQNQIWERADLPAAFPM